MTSDLKTCLDIARLALAFGRVNRVTRHENGATLESDTDHTVMLILVACSLAAKYTNLSVGLVAQLAAVHDFPESICGDTDTHKQLSLEEKKAKKAREQEAIRILEFEFGKSAPWIIHTIELYEEMECEEALFVWTVDKMLPKATHILNQCAAVPRVADNGYYEEQKALVHQRAALFPWLIELWQESVDETMKIQTGLEEERQARTMEETFDKLMKEVATLTSSMHSKDPKVISVWTSIYEMQDKLGRGEE
jgi:5'-deoxynucleotidase YfbR-like HD superfamily hydrolase